MTLQVEPRALTFPPMNLHHIYLPTQETMTLGPPEDTQLIRIMYIPAQVRESSEATIMEQAGFQKAMGSRLFYAMG